VKCSNKGFAFVPASSPDDPTAPFSLNMVFVGHGFVLSRYQNGSDVIKLLPELCQINVRGDFWRSDEQGTGGQKKGEP
jgi:hypothetical protein